MSHFGFLPSFDHTKNSWQIYKSRIHQWFIANDITSTTDEKGVKRRGILLSALSEKTYKLATDLALPKDIQDVEFEDIIKILDVHFTPKRLGFTERYKFYTAQQNLKESDADFIARLRGLSQHCEFKDAEEALRDRFVLGLRPGPARDKLFEQKLGVLTLADALDIAESIRCIQEVNDAQKWRFLPFSGETKVPTHQSPFSTGLFGAQSSQGTVSGETQKSVANIFGGTQQASPAATFGGTQQSAATVGGTQKSTPNLSFGGTQQSVATVGGAQKSPYNLSFGGTQQSSSTASFGGTKKQTGQALLFGTQTQSCQDGGTKKGSATLGETQTQTSNASTIGGAQTRYRFIGGLKPSADQGLFGVPEPQVEQSTLPGEPEIQPGNP